GAGVIGSHIVQRLVKEGVRITILDNLSTGTVINFAGLEKDLYFVIGDVRDTALVDKLARGQDCIIHHAALVSVPLSVKDPLTTHDINIAATLNVLNAARKTGVPKVIYAASSAVYGNNSVLPKREDFYPEPLSPYAVSKYAGELYIRLFSQLYGIQTVGFRYFNVFGPRQNPASPYAAVIPKFITRMLAGEQPVIYGDGEQTRDFIYVEDVARANFLALCAENLRGDIFNIASGHSTSINKIYTLISELLGVHIAPRYAEARLGDVRDSLADMHLAREALNFTPQYDLPAALDTTVRWYVKTNRERNRLNQEMVEAQ
ncbi:MAG TPA: LPS biosynthesis protein WbpP, partial [Firmicutes bacterium]|nr:LPS biosynthesis protein WbpP [Bacillota bacterium]